MRSDESFTVVAPGRICLFGEHSDYLGLNVIPAAINLNIKMKVNPNDHKQIIIRYSDMDNREDCFFTESEAPYNFPRDYVRSAYNVVRTHLEEPLSGAIIDVSGDIPIAAGLSSSSALAVASVMVFSHLGGFSLSTDEIARMAYLAEVEEFGESGGMQDHFASAYGGVIHLDVQQDYRVTRLPTSLRGLVIGDSMERKSDTVGDIRRLKDSITKEYSKIAGQIPDFDHRVTSVQRIYDLQEHCGNTGHQMAEATLRNRDLTRRALNQLNDSEPDLELIGNMLNEHHEILRNGLHRSTEKIERLINAALDAGALGCKINGSGGGGTMLALAPDREDDVVEAIRMAGGFPMRIEIGQGANISQP